MKGVHGSFVKGGIQAVDVGQMEAARSLGLPFEKRCESHPATRDQDYDSEFINQFIITLKDTSILSIIGILELT